MDLGSEFINGIRKSTRVRTKTLQSEKTQKKVLQRSPSHSPVAKTAKMPIKIQDTTRTTRKSPSPVAKTTKSKAKTSNPTHKTYETHETRETHETNKTHDPIRKSPQTPSPVARSQSSIGKIISQNTSDKPNDFLKYRLDIYDYLQTIQDLNYYMNIKKLLANIEPRATGIVCLSNNSEIILFDKKIKNFNFAIKIAENIKSDSVKEIYILQQMLKFIKNGYHNLPIIYNSFKKKKIEIMKNLESPIKDDIGAFLKDNKNYNIYINELAKGDLKKFLNIFDSPNNKINEELLLNAVAQILMAIASLHNIGIKHNDTHYGNFLYHEIKPGGYIKYTIGNDSYYVENLGYLWVIWDFGISTQLNGVYDYFRDYEMLSLFLREYNDKYNMRFIAKNEKNQEIRRNHGNLIFKHNNIPDTIVKLTNLIYKLSIDKKTNLIHDIPIAEGYALLQSKNSKIINNLSMSYITIYDDNGETVNETNFLTKHIIKLMSEEVPNLFQKNISISSNEILYEVNLTLDDIKYKLKKNPDGRNVSDYKETQNFYSDHKIILPSDFR